MNRQFIVLALLVVAGWVPQLTRAQSDGCSQFSIPLVLRDAHGELIHGYSPGDLEVKVNGKIAAVKGIHRESRPRRIVILLDASGSMKGEANNVPWSHAIASAKLLTSVSEGRARLAFLIFNTRIVEEIGFASDNSAVARRLSELERDQEFLDHKVYGTTHLNDAMNRGLELLVKPTSADELFVASDGGENGSRVTRREIQRKLDDGNVRVFVDVVESPFGHQAPTPEELQSGPELFELAERTGGAAMSLRSSGLVPGFRTKAKTVASEGLRMYFEGLFENEILEVSTANQDPGKRELKIALSASARDRIKGAQLFYPRQLYACAPTQGVSSTH